MIDILLLLLIILAIYKAEIIKPLSSVNESYLSLENCNQWRGWLALYIVLHHITKNVSSGILLPAIEDYSYVTVGIFFFYSGYGLMKKRLFSPDYKNGFIKKRIMPLFITWIIISALYCLTYIVCGYSLSAGFLLKELILNGNPIAEYSWYVVVILIFYFVFYIFLLTCKNDRLSIILCVLFYILFIIFCRIMGYGEWWYNTALNIMLGMTWALHEREINNFIKNNYAKSCLITLLVFGLMILVAIFKLYTFVPFGYAIIKIAFTCIFAIIILLFSMKITIKNPILNFVGKISLYVYLLQGMILRLLHTESIIYIKNDLVYAIVSIIVIVLLAYLFNMIDMKIRHALKSKK